MTISILIARQSTINHIFENCAAHFHKSEKNLDETISKYGWFSKIPWIVTVYFSFGFHIACFVVCGVILIHFIHSSLMKSETYDDDFLNLIIKCAIQKLFIWRRHSLFIWFCEKKKKKKKKKLARAHLMCLRTAKCACQTKCCVCPFFRLLFIHDTWIGRCIYSFIVIVYYQ